MNAAISKTIKSNVHQYINKQQYIISVEIEIFFSGKILYGTWQVPIHPTFRIFSEFIRRMCKIDVRESMIIKWVDNENNCCTLSSDGEVCELLRLTLYEDKYEQCRNQDFKTKPLSVLNTQPILLRVYCCQPPQPGHIPKEEFACSSLRRWHKLYVVNGHHFQVNRFNRNATCAVCRKTIWAIGFQWYMCVVCHIRVHKKCHKLVSFKCPEDEDLCMNNVVGNSQISTPNPIWSFKSPLRSFNTLKQSMNKSELVIASCRSTNQLKSHAFSMDSLSTDCLSMIQCENTLTSRSYSSISVVSFIPASINGQKPPEKRFNQISNSQNELNVLPGNKEKNMCSIMSYRNMHVFNFYILQVVGRGSYAKVFKVQEKTSCNVYAMKVIKKSILFNSDGDFEWVHTEKHVLEQVNGHPFLVGLHTCFQTDFHVFFIIDFVNGGDLMFHMQRLRFLSEEHTSFYSAEISVALHYLHSKGILYRDLKLDNVLLDCTGHIKLTDYGMCKEGLRIGQKTNTFCGTPNYIAPEMLTGKSYGCSVDWWALGILTFEMLVGRSPFSQSPEFLCSADRDTEDLLFQIILEQPIRIPKFLSDRATSILKGLLHKDPNQRLGCSSGKDLNENFYELISNPFFKRIDFQKLTERKINPPFMPPVEDKYDISCFDEEFTKAPILLTPENSFRNKRSEYALLTSELYEDFTYMSSTTYNEEDNPLEPLSLICIN